MKIGLPSYSNIDVGVGVTFEIGENEEVDWNEMWEQINRQLAVQTEGIDPAWIVNKEYKNFFRTVVKTPKLNKQ